MTRKEYDRTFPSMIHKTKSKYYVAVCPVCKEPSAVYVFRIEASTYLNGHLRVKHNMTRDQAQVIQNGITRELAPIIEAAKQQQRMC